MCIVRGIFKSSALYVVGGMSRDDFSGQMKSQRNIVDVEDINIILCFPYRQFWLKYLFLNKKKFQKNYMLEIRSS